MVERPIKKSERQAASLEGNAEGTEVSSSDQSSKREPRRVLDRDKDRDRRDRDGGRGKGKGKGRGKDRDSFREEEKPVNLALMRGPRPVKPQAPEPPVEEATVEEVATEEIIAEEVAAEESTEA